MAAVLFWVSVRFYAFLNSARLPIYGSQLILLIYSSYGFNLIKYNSKLFHNMILMIIVKLMVQGWRSLVATFSDIAIKGASKQRQFLQRAGRGVSLRTQVSSSFLASRKDGYVHCLGVLFLLFSFPTFFSFM